VAVVLVAAAITWGLDVALTHRVNAGTDNAVRLSAVLTYVGIDGSYTLARAFGLTALVLSYLAVVMPLLPGRPLPASLHRQTGIVTLALVAGHVFIPYSSSLPPYGGWRTGFVPWGQPVSWGIHAATWESFGIISFYLLIVTGPTYYLLGRRRAGWTILHRSAVLVYALSIVHAFLLGSDFLVAGPVRVILLLAQVPVLGLLAYRLAPGAEPARRGLRWAGAATAAAGSALVVGLGVLVATGGYAAGMRI
jgi:DMSO/TMAO reductase YedYZ heme-binding membrane subunit